MDGFPTPGSLAAQKVEPGSAQPSPAEDTHASFSDEDPLVELELRRFTCEFCPDAELPGVFPTDSPDDLDNEALLRSFDMVFQLHQRSEEMRARFDKIDRLLLESRTVASLTEGLIRVLHEELDVVSVRLLVRPDHALAAAFQFEAPTGVGVIPASLVEQESLFQSEPYVLDDPCGSLSRSLFGNDAPVISSAAVATLQHDGTEIGLLCLGSSDPYRYAGSMNTDLIAALADKIALGLHNAWDHESGSRRSLAGRTEEIYSEAFFREYVRKEFNRSWRHHRTFCLVAIRWHLSSPDSRVDHELTELIRAHLRCADLLGEGENVNLWVLLPDTGLDGAQMAAERISRIAATRYPHPFRVDFGITAFCREAAVMSMLMSHARDALARAMEQESNAVVVERVRLCGS